MQIERRDGGVWIRPQNEGDAALICALVGAYGVELRFVEKRPVLQMSEVAENLVLGA